MARIGDTVRPELGRTNYTPFLAGAQQGAAAMGRGIEQAGAGIGEYLKEQKKASQEATQYGKFFESAKEIYVGTPIGDQAAMMEAYVKDENNPLRDRVAAGRGGRDGLALMIQKGATDFDQQMRATAAGLDQMQTLAGIEATKANTETNRMNAEINRGRFMAGESANKASVAASQFLADYAQSGGGVPENVGTMLEAYAPDDPGAVEAYKGMVAQGITQMEAARQQAAMEPVELSPAEKARQGELGKFVAEWETSGRNTADTNLQELDAVIDLFDQGKIATGPAVGLLPDRLKPNTTDAQQRINRIVFQTLKATLGAQFTEKEAERLMKTSFDPNLPEEKNKAKLETLRDELKRRIETAEGKAREMQGGDGGGAQSVENMSAEDVVRALMQGGGGAQKKRTEPVGPQSLNTLPEPLAPLAPKFIEAGERHGVDPRFLAAISMLETARGTSSAFRNKRNAMGVSNSKGPIAFESPEDSIDRMARVLANPNGPYRGRSTVREIASVYAPPGAGNDPNKTNSYWPTGVAKFMRELGVEDPDNLQVVTRG